MSLEHLKEQIKSQMNNKSTPRALKMTENPNQKGNYRILLTYRCIYLAILWNIWICLSLENLQKPSESALSKKSTPNYPETQGNPNLKRRNAMAASH